MPTWTFSFLLFRFAVWRIFWHLFITWNQDAKSHKSFKSILGQFNKNSSLLQASLRYLNVFDVLYDIVCIAFCVSLDLCVTINPPTFWGELGSTVLSNMQRFESSTCSYCAFDTPGREETWKSHRNELEAYIYIYIHCKAVSRRQSDGLFMPFLQRIMENSADQLKTTAILFFCACPHVKMILSLICYQPLDLPPFATLATDQITVTWSCIVPHHLGNRLNKIIWVQGHFVGQEWCFLGRFTSLYPSTTRYVIYTCLAFFVQGTY